MTLSSRTTRSLRSMTMPGGVRKKHEKPGTSMIGKSQGKTEILLHFLGRVPQARIGF
jgi:hypothetical protein